MTLTDAQWSNFSGPEDTNKPSWPCPAPHGAYPLLPHQHCRSASFQPCSSPLDGPLGTTLQVLSWPLLLLPLAWLLEGSQNLPCQGLQTDRVTSPWLYTSCSALAGPRVNGESTACAKSPSAPGLTASLGGTYSSVLHHTHY